MSKSMKGTHYYRTGGNKPPVIFLHGLMTSGECFMPVVDRLKSQYDLILPDARGHGKSFSPKSRYTYDNLAADLIDLVEELNLRRPFLVGHSMNLSE